MNILLLEDRGSVSYYLIDFLSSEGHRVFQALSINDAKSVYNKHGKEIDCIITDLNMSSMGLTEEQAIQTCAGLLSGWIWVKEYVFPSHPEMRKRTAIYSDYLANLKEKTWKKDLDGICLIPKRGSDTDEKLLSFLNSIKSI
jgi:hypothetical protein